jgi:hypothetical protein|eukprot:COSAG02_NODE_795_length_17133_cov_6.577727_22_plen_200_part_00
MASARSRHSSILDRSLDKRRAETSLSSFAFLFGEMVQYCRDRAETLADLEKKLERLGHRVGSRTLELSTWRERGGRERNGRREIRVLQVLSFIQNTVWKSLFGKPADDIQKSVENEGEYYMIDAKPLVNTFISVPAEMGGQLNCGAFLAGIVQGCLDGAEFPAEVSAQSVDNEDGSYPPRTFIIVKFSPEVIERERRMG